MLGLLFTSMLLLVFYLSFEINKKSVNCISYTTENEDNKLFTQDNFDFLLSKELNSIKQIIINPDISHVHKSKAYKKRYDNSRHKASHRKKYTPNQTQIQEIETGIVNNDTSNDYKYFYEYGFDKNTNTQVIKGGDKYDVRYFQQFLNYDKSRKTLISLFKSWLAFIETQRIQSWLAHGTLIGWYWGKNILPWDDDLDVQMLCSDLNKLYKKK